LLDNHVTFHLRGRRAAAPRQQTLSATLDWSYNLLPEVERSVLRRLSVFVGRFSLEAAQVVAAGGAVDGWQVVESTDHLVTKSLASLDPAGPTLRYRLLDTTRRYLYQRPEASGEAAEISPPACNVLSGLTCTRRARAGKSRRFDAAERSHQ
jgi:predicted ATPase